MDPILKSKLTDKLVISSGSDGTPVETEIAEKLTVKSLVELYWKGERSGTVDPQSDEYMPLFFSIEEEIVRVDQSEGPITDGGVMLTLDKLQMSPEAPSIDLLATALQDRLRLTLSLNNYSRQEVRQALRKVMKSVRRHANGTRGYLNFIAQFIGSR